MIQTEKPIKVVKAGPALMAVIRVGVIAGIGHIGGHMQSFVALRLTSLHWRIDFLTFVTSDRSSCTHGIRILYRVSKKVSFSKYVDDGYDRCDGYDGY